MRKITLFLFLTAFATNLTTSCSKSSSDENNVPTALVFSNALNGSYSGTGVLLNEQVTGNVSLSVSSSTNGSYTGVIGNVLLSNVTNNGGSNFKAKNQLSGTSITLSFSGANNKTLTIVDGNSTFTGTKP